MAFLEPKIRQRLVGALVMVSIAVIVIPEIFSRPNVKNTVIVDVPEMPEKPSIESIKPRALDSFDPSNTPITNNLTTESVKSDQAADQTADSMTESQENTHFSSQTAPSDSMEIQQPESSEASIDKMESAQASEIPRTLPAQKLIDDQGRGISWTIQVASLSNGNNAMDLQKKLRSQGYNAYVIQSAGTSRVMIGPIVNRTQAEAIRDSIFKKIGVKGFLTRFEPSAT